jgi:hypothetical protein
LGTPSCVAALPSSWLEHLRDASQSSHEVVDFLGGVVEIKACPGAGRNTERIVEGLGAVVPSPDGYPLEIEQLGDVVGVGLSEGEAHETRSMDRRWAEDREPFDLRELVVGIFH